MMDTTSAQNIRLSLPPSDNNPDISIGSTQLQASGDAVIDYIKLTTEYLWIAMIVLLFALLVWTGFKIMTQPWSESKGILKQWLWAAGIGLAIVLFSYTIVRLVINLL